MENAKKDHKKKAVPMRVKLKAQDYILAALKELQVIDAPQAVIDELEVQKTRVFKLLNAEDF